jgi:hypothetical protein
MRCFTSGEAKDATRFARRDDRPEPGSIATIAQGRRRKMVFRMVCGEARNVTV